MNIYLEKIKTLSNSQKYYRIYEKIIKRASSRIVFSYKNIYSAKKYVNKKYGKYKYEAHHILPKCISDENSKNDINNIAFLTLKEHLICHKILALRLLKNNNSILQAFYAIFKKRDDNQKYRLMNNREILFFKQNYSNFLTRKGIKNGMYGKKHTDITKNKIRLKAIGRKLSDERLKELREYAKKTCKENSWRQIKKHHKNFIFNSYEELENFCLEESKKGLGIWSIGSKINLSGIVIRNILKRFNIEENKNQTMSKILKRNPNFEFKTYKELCNFCLKEYNNKVTINKISKNLNISRCAVEKCIKNQSL